MDKKNKIVITGYEIREDVPSAVHRRAEDSASEPHANSEQMVASLKRRLHQLNQSVNQIRFQSQIDEVRRQYEGTEQWMKAPNGKPTRLTERQWLQVRTPAFTAWFGDWENDPQNASKVVDENGEPLVVYHETENKFDVFDPERRTHSQSDYIMPAGIFTKTSSKSIHFGFYKLPFLAGRQTLKEDVDISGRCGIIKLTLMQSA